MKFSFTAALVATSAQIVSARFWWDGYGYRVFGEENPPTCSVSVCSMDTDVGCRPFLCTSREDISAIAADDWFVLDDHTAEYWYMGPGDGAWMLQDITDGVENW